MEIIPMVKNNHYSVDELFLYSHNMLTEEKRAAIDEHLLECEWCQTLFFRLLEEEGAVAAAQKQVPVDFTEKLLLRIADEPPRLQVKKVISKKPNRRQYLAGYAAVATFTLFLSWNGVFAPVAQAEDATSVKAADPIVVQQGKISSALDDFLTNIQNSSNQAKDSINGFFSNTLGSGK